MQNTIPAYLISTYKLISCTFADGIEPKEYFALLAILYDELSDRNLAEVIAYCTGKDYRVVLNDVYRINSTNVPKPEVIEEVKQRLMLCGYETWLKQG